MNRKLSHKFKLFLVIGTIGVAGMSLVGCSAPKETAQQSVNEADSQACTVAGYIQDTITGINVEAHQIILGDINDPEAQIIVNITEQTSLKNANSEEVLTFEALQVGQTITLESNGMMIAGQVDAIEITLVE